MELLHDIPTGLILDTEGRLLASLEQSRGVFDSTDRKHASGPFSGGDAGGTGLPARRGYYLGFLVAREAAGRRDLDALAGPSVQQAQPPVAEAVKSMRARARHDAAAR